MIDIPWKIGVTAICLFYSIWFFASLIKGKVFHWIHYILLPASLAWMAFFVYMEFVR